MGQEPDAFRIACRRCGVESRVFGTQGEAIAAWNRRSDLSPSASAAHPFHPPAEPDSEEAFFVALRREIAAAISPPTRIAKQTSLAALEALAERCKAGDVQALEEYPDAARAALDAAKTEQLAAAAAAQDRYMVVFDRIVALNDAILTRQEVKP